MFVIGNFKKKNINHEQISFFLKNPRFNWKSYLTFWSVLLSTKTWLLFSNLI